MLHSCKKLKLLGCFLEREKNHFVYKKKLTLARLGKAKTILVIPMAKLIRKRLLGGASYSTLVFIYSDLWQIRFLPTIYMVPLLLQTNKRKIIIIKREREALSPQSNLFLFILISFYFLLIWTVKAVSFESIIVGSFFMRQMQELFVAMHQCHEVQNLEGNSTGATYTRITKCDDFYLWPPLVTKKNLHLIIKLCFYYFFKF